MIERLYTLLDHNFDAGEFSALLSGELSTTTIILLSVVPLCLALFIREVVCWFYKVNGLLRRINRLESQLKRIADLLEQRLPKQQEPTVAKPPLMPDLPKVDIEIKRRDF